jgi:hypothetical protein
MRTSSYIVALAATLLLSGCGSDNSDNSTPSNTNTPSVSTPSEDTNTTPVVSMPSEDTNTTTMVSTSAQKLARTALVTTTPILTDRNIAAMIHASTSLTAPQLRVLYSTSKECSTDGTRDVVLETTSTATITYHDCDMGDGVVINGGATLTDIVASGTTLSSATIKLDVTSTSNAITNVTDLTMDFVSNGSKEAYTTTMNGTISTTATSYSAEVQYTDYTVTSTASTVSIDGTVAINNTPDSCGSNGTYTIETVSPMSISDYGTITSGEMNINNNNYVFHSDDTVTIASGETIAQSELATCETEL